MRYRTAPHPRSNQVEQGLTGGLSRLLRELALPLLRAGVTPRRIADIAADAFVDAACGAATMRNGRVNQSRVSVLTGLSRVEVRRLIASKAAPAVGNLPRTARVVDGWSSDRRFMDSSGHPRTLKIRGPGNTFEALVKMYAGDVPHRAVLDELCRLKVVLEADSSVTLIEPRSHGRRRLERRLESVLPLIADGVAIAVSEERGQEALLRLSLDASGSRDLAIIRERADSSAKAWLSGLRESLLQTGLSRGAKGRPKQRVTITVLVHKRDLVENKRR